MSTTRRERILAAAAEGRISFYEGTTRDEQEFDCRGEPFTVRVTHGVCDGCVYEAGDLECPDYERCSLEDPLHRVATVAEVTAYLDREP